MSNSICLENNYFLGLSSDEMFGVSGGANIADWAAAAGGVFSATVTAGQVGWLGAAAVTVCSAPVVATAAAVVGVACAGYGVYCLFR